MTLPFWCLFIAAVLPYVWFSFAAPLRIAQFGKSLDNHAPRSQDALLRDRAARAQGAHVNSLEALTYFGPAVLVAHLTHADPTWVGRLCVLFVVLRILHGAVYIGDVPPARTAFFALGLLTSIGIFVVSAMA